MGERTRDESKAEGFSPALEPLVRTLMSRHLMGGIEVSPGELERAVRPSRWRLYVGFACFVVVPLIPAGIGLLVSHWIVTRRAGPRVSMARLVDGVLERGRLRMAWPVMFNSEFMKGRAPVGAGLVIACLDDGPEPANDHMLEIVDRLCMAGFSGGAEDPELERRLAALMDDERFQPMRRRRIPEPLARGRAIYALDLGVAREELVADLKDLPWIPCLVEPGERGGVLVVPGSVMAAAREANGGRL